MSSSHVKGKIVVNDYRSDDEEDNKAMNHSRTSSILNRYKNNYVSESINSKESKLRQTSFSMTTINKDIMEA